MSYGDKHECGQKIEGENAIFTQSRGTYWWRCRACYNAYQRTYQQGLQTKRQRAKRQKRAR